MKHLRNVISLAAALLISAVAAQAETTAILAKARSYLGEEAVLNGVRSVRYRGMVERQEKAADGTERPVASQIEIIFQRDYQQLVTQTGVEGRVLTALNGYEGWSMSEDANGRQRAPLLFGKDRIKRLRASVWQNLSFYRGIESVGGHLEDHGVVEIDGTRGHKISFVHEPGIVYVRYFDVDTGRLLFTETDLGIRIREEGELRVDGIRFPKRIINMTTGPDGKEHVVTITINEVAVNTPFPDELFSVPLAPRR